MKYVVVVIRTSRRDKYIVARKTASTYYAVAEVYSQEDARMIAEALAAAK
jgi:hypothetical protein